MDKNNLEITMPTKAMLDVLKSVYSIINDTLSLEIYSHVMFSVNKGKFSLTALNREIQSQRFINTENHSIPINGYSEDGYGENGVFKVLIPAKKLFNVLKELKNGDSTFSFDGVENSLKITSGNCKFTLQTKGIDEYPLRAPVEKPHPSFSIPCKILHDALKHVAFSAAINDVRYYLRGVFFEITHVVDNRYLNLVATDGNRMSFYEGNIPDAGIVDSEGFIVSIDCISGLLKLCSFDNFQGNIYGNIDIFVNEDIASFVIDDEIVTITKIEGTYPDYRKVLFANLSEVEFFSIEKINSKAFLGAISRAFILVQKDNKKIKLTLENNSLIVSSKNGNSEESEVTIDVDYNDFNIEGVYNGKYLIEAVKASKSEFIKLTLCDNGSCLIETEPDNQYYKLKYIIMGMR